jgi:Fic family protein
MSWNPKAPFNALPLLPPDQELETTRVLKQCIRSRTALAELNQAADFLPTKELLINNMPLLVARARGKKIYTPPVGESLIREKLANLETFIHRDSDPE